MTGPLLSVRDLRVEFATRKGPLVALDGVSFDIAPGEVLGVVGESGAGKSLTGLAIIGLLDPPGRIAGGEISFAGKRIDSLPPAQMRDIRGRRIGIIFQQDRLLPWRSSYDNVRLPLELMRVPEDVQRERAMHWLKRLGLENFTNAYPHELSGGMRQRVLIATAGLTPKEAHALDLFKNEGLAPDADQRVAGFISKKQR